MANSNQNTDAFADGFRFRIEVFGAAGLRMTPEFSITKAEAGRRRKTLREAGMVASIFRLREGGGLTNA